MPRRKTVAILWFQKFCKNRWLTFFCMGVKLIEDSFLEVHLKIPTHSLISALLPFALFVACDKKKEEPPAAPVAQEEAAATEAQPAEGAEAKPAEGAEAKKPEEEKK
jgi:hypothetical protein